MALLEPLRRTRSSPSGFSLPGLTGAGGEVIPVHRGAAAHAETQNQVAGPPPARPRRPPHHRICATNAGVVERRAPHGRPRTPLSQPLHNAKGCPRTAVPAPGKVAPSPVLHSCEGPPQTGAPAPAEVAPEPDFSCREGAGRRRRPRRRRVGPARRFYTTGRGPQQPPAPPRGSRPEAQRKNFPGPRGRDFREDEAKKKDLRQEPGLAKRRAVVGLTPPPLWTPKAARCAAGDFRLGQLG